MSHFDEMKLVAVPFYQLGDVPRVDVDRRCVVTRMYAHKLVFEVLVDIDHHVPFLVAEYSERSDRSADEPHLIHEFIFGRERQRPRVVLLSELLEIYLFVFETCDQIVLALLVVADEEVLCDLLRMRQIALEHLIDSVDSLVFGYLISDLAVVKKLKYFFFCYYHLYALSPGIKPADFFMSLFFTAGKRAQKVAAYGRTDIAAYGAALLAEHCLAYSLAYLSAYGAAGRSDDLFGAGLSEVVVRDLAQGGPSVVGRLDICGLSFHRFRLDRVFEVVNGTVRQITAENDITQN